MNWTGGALNRHSHNNHYSGKTSRNCSQAVMQRQHFARLRKERGKRHTHTHTHMHTQRSMVFGGRGDVGGDGDGSEVSVVFVPEWGRRRLHGESSWMRRDDGGGYDDDDDDDGDYGNDNCGVTEQRHAGHRKTLREFEELVRAKEQKENDRRHKIGRCSVLSDSGSRDSCRWSSMDGSRSESENDTLGIDQSEICCKGKEDRKLDGKMQTLLRREDWAGLKHCRTVTHCIGREKGSVDGGSKVIYEKSMLARMCKSRKRKRNSEVDESDADGDMLMDGDYYLGEKDGRPVPTFNHFPGRYGRSDFKRPPRPTHRSPYREYRHLITKPNSNGEDIDDEDISIRIGSDALGSVVASRPYLRERENERQEMERAECDDDDDDYFQSGDKGGADESEEGSDARLMDDDEDECDVAPSKSQSSSRYDSSSVSRADTDLLPPVPDMSYASTSEDADLGESQESER